MRSIAMACAIKGGREIAVIGHTDCKVSQTSSSSLIECFKTLGVPREKLPDNIADYFGLFSGIRQNVIHGVEVIRSSPLIGANVVIQGLVIDIQTGALDWVVNGYEMPARVTVPAPGLAFPTLDAAIGSLVSNRPFQMGEKIGEEVQKVIKAAEQTIAAKTPVRSQRPFDAGGAPPLPHRRSWRRRSVRVRFRFLHRSESTLENADKSVRMVVDAGSFFSFHSV